MINLEKYVDLKNELNYISLTIEELTTQLYKIKNNNITDLPRYTSQNKDDKLIRLIEKVDKKINLYQSKYEKCIDELEIILSIIEELKGIEKVIITEKYINDLTWDEISEITHYSRMQLYRIHKNILKKINMLQDVT